MSNVNLHTCEKAAAGWHAKSTPCKQCEKDKKDAAFFNQFHLAPDLSPMIAIGAEKQGIKHAPLPQPSEMKSAEEWEKEFMTNTKYGTYKSLIDYARDIQADALTSMQPSQPTDEQIQEIVKKAATSIRKMGGSPEETTWEGFLMANCETYIKQAILSALALRK